MKNLNFAIGLPRSGSTLLMNILQQNPMIFTSSTCPTTYLVEGCKQAAGNVSEFIAMDQDVMTNAVTSFIRSGIDGWFSSMTDKPIVFSKSRQWDRHLNVLFNIYEDPKFIVIIRDLRDIICSFEKLSHTYPIWTIGSQEDPFHMHSFEKRMEIYCTDVSGNLGLPLKNLIHVFEWMNRRPNNFFLCRFEDFNQNPQRSLFAFYNWMNLPYYEHDLNNIPQAEQYEHDSAYRALVSHKTKPQFVYTEPTYKSVMTPKQSKLVIQHNEWFYQTFYPEVYYDYLNNRL